MNNEELNYAKSMIKEGFLPYGRLFFRGKDNFMFEGVQDQINYISLLVNYTTGERRKLGITKQPTLDYIKGVLDETYKKCEGYHLNIICRAIAGKGGKVHLDKFIKQLQESLADHEVAIIDHDKFSIYSLEKTKDKAKEREGQIDELLVTQSVFNPVSFIILHTTIMPKIIHTHAKSTDTAEIIPNYISSKRYCDLNYVGSARALRLAKASTVEAGALNFYLEGLYDLYKEDRDKLLSEQEIKDILSVIAARDKETKDRIKTLLRQLYKGESKNKLLAKQLSEITAISGGEVYESLSKLIKLRGTSLHSTSGKVDNFHKLKKSIEHFYAKLFE